MTNKTAFVAWKITKRTKVLAGHLGADLITYRTHFSNAILRIIHYKLLSFSTIVKLCLKKYKTIYVQIPSIQEAITVYLFGKIFRTKIVFDTHSGIFFPKTLHQRIYLRLYCSMARHIKLNLVHNQSLLKHKCLLHSPTTILEDKLSYQPVMQTESKPIQIGVICSWAKDEPILETISAIKMLPEYNFFITGNFKKFIKQMTQLPKNTNLTGYLSDKEYDDLLKKMDIIVVLTKRPDTVLCGAYEAVSLCKPLILSDTETLRTNFYKGVIHTQNNGESIKQAITNAIANMNKLQKEIIELRKEKEADWQKQFAVVENILKK
jgi:hypothetical protein